jgi:hypothetical protein
MKYGFFILALTARALANGDKGEQVEVKTVGVQPGTTILHTGALTQVQTVPAGGNESPQSAKVVTSPLSKQVFNSVRESEKTISPSKQGGQPAAQQDTTTASVAKGSTLSTRAAVPQENSSKKPQPESETQKPGGGGEQPQTTTAAEPQGPQESPQPGSSPEGESSSKTASQKSTTGGASPQQETEAPSPADGDGDGDGFDPYDGLHNGTDPLPSFETGPEPTGPAVAAPIFPVMGDEDAEEVQVPQTLREAAKSNANKNNRVKNDTPFKNPLDGHLPVLNAGNSAPEKVPDSVLVKVGKHRNGTDTESQSNSDQPQAETQTSASQSAPSNNFQASKSAATEPTPSTLIDTTSMSLKVNDQKKHTSTSASAPPSVQTSSAVSTPSVSHQSTASSQ